MPLRSSHRPEVLHTCSCTIAQQAPRTFLTQTMPAHTAVRNLRDSAQDGGGSAAAPTPQGTSAGNQAASPPPPFFPSGHAAPLGASARTAHLTGPSRGAGWDRLRCSALALLPCAPVVAAGGEAAAVMVGRKRRRREASSGATYTGMGPVGGGATCGNMAEEAGSQDAGAGACTSARRQPQTQLAIQPGIPGLPAFIPGRRG